METKSKVWVWVLFLHLQSVLVLHAQDEQSVPIGKNQFHVQNDVLMRGSSPFIIQGVHVPSLLSEKTSFEKSIDILNRIADVGANTVCFDLEDFGAFLHEEEPQIVFRVKSLIEQVLWRRLGAICHIPGKTSMGDEDRYHQTLCHVGEALKDLNTVIYWIDGELCEKCIESFSAKAPTLLVASNILGPLKMRKLTREEFRDISDTSGLTILYGCLPPKDKKDKVHFVVSFTEENLSLLDKMNAAPIELEEWCPDNNTLSEDEKQQGWISLFDGKTLNGWTIVGPNSQAFQVVDGAIVRTETGGVMLRTRDRYENFILRLEWRINRGGNSGIFLRAPRGGRCSKIGLEFQLMGDYGNPCDKYSTGAIYDVVPPLINASKPEGEWNELELILNGSHLKAILNGQVVQDLNMDDDPELRLRLKKGFIALQDHGHPAAFRNIRIKPL